MDNSNKSLDGLKTNPIIQLLASGSQNTVGQIITSISQEFDKINNQAINNALSSKYPFFLLKIINMILIFRWNFIYKYINIFIRKSKIRTS